MEQLSMNKAIAIMKQDKGRGVVVMNWSQSILTSVCQFYKANSLLN